MAAGRKLLLKQALLHICSLYLMSRGNGGEVKGQQSGWPGSCVTVSAFRIKDEVTQSHRLGPGIPMSLLDK